MDSIAFSHLQAAGFRVYVPEVATLGDTGTPSRIHIEARDLAGVVSAHHVGPLRVRVCNDGTFANATNATIVAAAGSALLEALTANKDLLLSEVRGSAASRTLTLTGAVAPGETVTIGGRVYQFVAGAPATGTNLPVDIAAATTAAQGTLTVDTQPTLGDSLTVGSRTYVFVTDGDDDNPGEISRGTDLGTAQAAIVAAINGTDGHNLPHPLVTAGDFAENDSVLTAIVAGTGGDAVTTTETFAAGTNVFDGTTLGTTTAGVDAAAGAAITALVAAITADVAAVVTAVDGDGDTVVATAKSVGVVGKEIASAAAMDNASWGGAGFAGGVDALPGTYALDLTNATAETVTLRVGPAPQGGGFGDCSAALEVTHDAPE